MSQPACKSSQAKKTAYAEPPPSRRLKQQLRTGNASVLASTGGKLHDLHLIMQSLRLSQSESVRVPRRGHVRCKNLGPQTRWVSRGPRRGDVRCKSLGPQTRWVSRGPRRGHVRCKNLGPQTRWVSRGPWRGPAVSAGSLLRRASAPRPDGSLRDLSAAEPRRPSYHLDRRRVALGPLGGFLGRLLGSREIGHPGE